MTRSVCCFALLALLTACGGASFQRGAGSTPVGTDASTGQPNTSTRGAGGVNRDYYIGANPNFPESGSSGRR